MAGSTQIISQSSKTKVVSAAIVQIIDELYSQHKMKFHIVQIGENFHLSDIRNQIVTMSSSPVVSFKYANESDYKIDLFQPQVMLYSNQTEKLISWTILTDTFADKTRLNTNVKPMIISYDEFEVLENLRNYSRVENVYGHIFDIHYLMPQWQKFRLLLYRSVLFQTGWCDKALLLVKNKFAIKTMKWRQGNQFMQRYENFNKCKVNAMMISEKELSLKHFGFIERSENNKTITLAGINGDLANIFGIKYQFEFNIIHENDPKFSRSPVVFIGLNSMSEISIDSTRVYSSRTTSTGHFYLTFYVTRGVTYTPFEKFILPFDGETWFLIVFLFLIGFFTIFIVYRMPKKVQNLIFGSSNKNPSLSMTQSFFGIGIIQVPSQNFARYIFMLFTLYCLIIRNSYQGKMFEFITGDVHRPTVKTLQDIVDKKIPIVTAASPYLIIESSV